MTIIDKHEQNIEHDAVAHAVVDQLRETLARRQADGEAQDLDAIEAAMVGDDSLTVDILHRACTTAGLEFTATQSRKTLIHKLMVKARAALATEGLAVRGGHESTATGDMLTGFSPWRYEPDDERSILLRRLCEASRYSRKVYVGGMPADVEEAATHPAERLLVVRIPRKDQMPAVRVVCQEKGDDTIEVGPPDDRREVAPWVTVATRQVVSESTGRSLVDWWYERAVGELAAEALTGAFDDDEPTLEGAFDDED